MGVLCQIRRKDEFVKYLGFFAWHKDWKNLMTQSFLGFLGKISFARIVVLGFAVAIGIGSLILFLTEGGSLRYVDALFLSASALCVTGLSPVPVSDLSHGTHWVLLVLIQLGGLGIISVTVVIGFLVKQGLSRNTKFHQFVTTVIDQEDSGKNDLDGSHILRILRAVVSISFFLEALGALVFYFKFPIGVEGFGSRVFLCVFTSISAFNNAGFSLLSDASFLKESPASLYLVSILVILGGIGFPVIILMEKWLLTLLYQFTNKVEVAAETVLLHLIVKGKLGKLAEKWLEKPAELSYRLLNRIEDYNVHLYGESNLVQTKIILSGTAFLLTFGTLGIFFYEYNNFGTLQTMDFWDKVANSFFLSVCSRTAGFSTIDLGQMMDPSIVLITMLMFIGGGPQGTAGGIKLTTFALLFAYIRNVIKPANNVTVFGGTISKNSLAIAIRVYFLGTIMLAGLFLILVSIDPEKHGLQRSFFELISAFSTVGYSLGLTSELHDIEKLVYTCIMLGGRVGIFTMLIAFTGHSGVPKIGEEDNDIKIQLG